MAEGSLSGRGREIGPAMAAGKGLRVRQTERECAVPAEHGMSAAGLVAAEIMSYPGEVESEHAEGLIHGLVCLCHIGGSDQGAFG